MFLRFNRYFALIFAVSGLIIFGCAETEVDNNIRVLVKGKVVDQNNLPINNANIEVYTDANTPGALPVLLGLGTTDNLGGFEITSLFGSNSIFYVEVFLDNQFSKYTFQTTTPDFYLEDLIFDLQTVTLNQISIFNYSITRSSPDGTSLEFSFKFSDPDCFQTFDEGILNEQQSFCFQDRMVSRILNDTRPNVDDAQFIIPLNASIEFTYKINDGPEVTEIINSNTTNYEFEFSY